MTVVTTSKPQAPARLPRSLRSTIYGVGAGLWLTGVLWLVFHYFLQQQTEFGPHPHPLEFWWRAAHGFFAFASLWTLGLLWGAHIVNAWKSGQRGISGIILLGVLAWLIGSGYLLYYLGNEQLLTAVTLAHWCAGIVLPALFIIHRLTSRRRAHGN